MTQAVCFKCGEIKWGAFGHCGRCQAMPRTDEELMLSLAFTDHFFEAEKLSQIGDEIKDGRVHQLSDAWKERLTPEVQEAKRILGIGLEAKRTELPKQNQPNNVRSPKRVHYVLVVLLFILSAAIASALLGALPRSLHPYLAYIVVPVGIMGLLWSWSASHAKRRGDQNELDVLEETIQDHERGRHDNTEYIKKQILFIERDHEQTRAVRNLLERARRAIGN